MQTFLPSPHFRDTLMTLDRRRLGKQRLEALYILAILKYVPAICLRNTLGMNKPKGYFNHPAVNMWRGYEEALALYYNTACEVFNKGKRYKLQPIEIPERIEFPPWLGTDLAFHYSHYSNFISKGIVKPKDIFNVPEGLPYIWPGEVSNKRNMVELCMKLNGDEKKFGDCIRIDMKRMIERVS